MSSTNNRKLPDEVVENIEFSLSGLFPGCQRADPGRNSRSSLPVFWDSRSGTVDILIEIKGVGVGRQKTAWRGRFKLEARPSLTDLEFAGRLATLYCHDIEKTTKPDGVLDLNLWKIFQATFWVRAIAGHCEFKGKPFTNHCLDTMLRSAQLTYEGHRPRHAVIITANERFTRARSTNWFVRFKKPISINEALIEEKWVRALVDGQRSILVAKADEKGSIHGLVSLGELPGDKKLTRFLYGAKPNDHVYETAIDQLDDIYERTTLLIESSPSMEHFNLFDGGLEHMYAPHLNLLPTLRLLDPLSMAIVVSEAGDTFVILPGGSVFRYSQSAWTYIHYPTLHRLVEPIAGEVLTIDLIRLILDLSFEHTGSLLVVTDDSSSDILSRLAPDFSHPRRPNRGLRDALRGQSVCVWGVRQLVASAAAVDGAIILDKTGRVLDVACMIGQANEDMERKDGVPPGSRSQAAKRASMFGLAFKVSLDGQITCYRNGDIFFSV